MKGRQYDEKLVEDLIKLHPKDFLGEDFRLLSQQRALEGFRPDLIFEDSTGVPVIVEVQLDALDRHHLYRVLEYRDLLLAADGLQTVRTILFSNSIPTRYRKILSTHNVETVTLTKEEVLTKAHELEPTLAILDRPHEEQTPRSSALTAEMILLLLAARRGANPGQGVPNVVVFWERGWNDRHDDLVYLRLVNLRHIENQSQVFYNDWNSRPQVPAKRLLGLTDARGCQVEPQVPIERIVSANLFETPLHKIKVLHDWLLLLCIYSGGGGEYADGEVVLGWREGPDIYGYERYIKGNIKLFQTLRGYRLTSITSRVMKYDRQQIADDLTAFNAIKLFAGKYPNLVPLSFFESFELLNGPGHLHTHWSNLKNELRTVGMPERITALEREYQNLGCEWTTVRFKGISRTYVHTMYQLLNHLVETFSNEHTDWRNDKLVFGEKCTRCLIRPAFMRELSPKAIEMSTCYFAHLKHPDCISKDQTVVSSSFDESSVTK